MSRLTATCDDVFEVLTSGPFPRRGGSGLCATFLCEDDAAIERHLVACHECRMLAEALRPAVRLIEEATLEDDSQLPAYRGSLPFPGDRVAAHPVTLPPRRGAESGWKYLAAAALGFALFALFHFGANDDRSRRERPLTVEAKYAPTAEGLRQLTALGLPMACLTQVEDRAADGSLTSHTDARFACCTGCHSAANPSRPTVDAIASVMSSCLACHDQP
jgi:hypothetical protein